MLHPATRAGDVLRFCREFSQSLPDEVVIQGGNLTAPDGTRVFGVAACYCGRSLSEGRESVESQAEILAAGSRYDLNDELS